MPRGLLTSRGAPGHREVGTRRQVCTAHGITVHRGLIEARKIEARHERCCDDTPRASGQRHVFNTKFLRGVAEDARQRNVERDPLRREAETRGDRVHDRRQGTPAAAGFGKARTSMASSAAMPGRGEPDMRPRRASQTSSSA